MKQKKISLEEVAISTKISIRILQAIEDGDLSKLPAKPFVRGFIQSYGRYLGLDTKEVLDKFQEAVGATKPQPQILLPESGKLDNNLPGSGRNMFTIASIILVIIAIVVVQRLISQREAEMHSGEVQAITGSDTPLHIKPLATPSPLESPTPAASLTPSVTPNTETTPSASPTPEMPSPTPTPSPLSNEASLILTTPAPTPTSTPTPTPASSPEALVPQEVIIEALDHVTIKVTIDNKPTQEFTMNADQIQTFKAKGRIRIYTPNGGAISIIQNGFDIGVPGNLGQPKLMVFPR